MTKLLIIYCITLLIALTSKLSGEEGDWRNIKRVEPSSFQEWFDSMDAYGIEGGLINEIASKGFPNNDYSLDYLALIEFVDIKYNLIRLNGYLYTVTQHRPMIMEVRLMGNEMCLYVYACWKERKRIDVLGFEINNDDLSKILEVVHFPSPVYEVKVPKE